MFVAIDILGKDENVVDRYRWGSVTSIGRYSLDTYEPDPYGDILIWETVSEYDAVTQQARLATGWYASKIGDSIESVLDQFDLEYA